MDKKEQIALELTKALIIAKPELLEKNEENYNMFSHYADNATELFSWETDYVGRKLDIDK